MKFRYSREIFQDIVNNSISITEVCQKTGHCVYTVTKYIKELNIDTSKLKGQAWNKGNFTIPEFKEGKKLYPSTALTALILERGRCCQNCGNQKWMNQDIPLEVHHVNGNKLDNRRENLLLLCNNCHALTETFRGKNRDGKNQVSDIQFAEVLKNSKNIRQALISLGLTPKGGNYARAYDLITKYNIKHLLEP